MDPRSVNSSAVWKMLIYINQWTKNLNNVKFLNTYPAEKNSVLGSFGIISEAFNNIGIYSKAPPPAPLSLKIADSPSPPQTCPPPLILIPLPLRQHQLLRLLALLWVAVHGRRRRRWWNVLEHYMIRHMLTLILPSTCSTWHVPIRGQESHAWLTTGFCTWTHCSKTWQPLPLFQHVQQPLLLIHCGHGWVEGCSSSPPPPHPTNFLPHWLSSKLNNGWILLPVIQRPVSLYHQCFHSLWPLQSGDVCVYPHPRRFLSVMRGSILTSVYRSGCVTGHDW